MSFASARNSSPWLAVAGVCGIYISFGMAIGVMAPMVDEITADLGLTRSAMGSILGAWALIYVFTAVPAGAAVDRLGLRTSLAIGGLSITASLLLRSVASGAISLFVAVAVFGIGGPLVSIATPKLVASLFSQDSRRLPTGLGVASPAIGSAITLALTDPLLLPIAGDSWRRVLLIVAAVAFTTTIAWLFASRAVTSVDHGVAPADRASLKRLIGLRSMRRILTISLFSFFVAHALSNWLPEILADNGQSENRSGYLAALSVTVGIAGSLVIARLVPTNRRPHALLSIFIVLTITVLGLSTLSLTPLVASLAVLGFARAGIIPLLFLEIMGDPDIELADIGAATGLFFAIGEIGGFCGPYAVGYIADRTDGFEAATVALAGVCLAAAIPAWSLISRTKVAT